MPSRRRKQDEIALQQEANRLLKKRESGRPLTSEEQTKVQRAYNRAANRRVGGIGRLAK